MRNEHTDYFQQFDSAHRYQANVRHMAPASAAAAAFPPASAITGSPLAGPGDLAYRGSHSGYYGSGDKYYSAPGATVPGWPGAYPEPADGGDYGLQYNSYPHLSQDSQYMVPAGAPGSYRPPKGPYMMPTGGSNYTYEATAPASSLDHRSSVSSESTAANFNFSNITAALPSHLTERQQLPAPTRTLSSSAILPYRDSSSYPTSKAPPSSSTNTSPTTPLADAHGPGYGSFDSSYPPIPTRAAADMYPPPPPADVFAPDAAAALRSQSPANDAGSSYTYSTAAVPTSAAPENRRDSGYRVGSSVASVSAHHGAAYVGDLPAGVTAGGAQVGAA